ncbi:MAG TPA: hypothetical protein VGR95_14545, partial [Thermoanaerobaculia bacterium]|nr:hypothetical protein [Thermoanaerobaculia bacterium]
MPIVNTNANADDAGATRLRFFISASGACKSMAGTSGVLQNVIPQVTQIAFVTLFLGLTLGSQPVELRVTGPVHHIELRLDDTVRGVIAAPPWKTTIDVGDHLLPHRLTAIAMDAAGHELARAEQTINVPRRSAETAILLERGADGRTAKAHLLWRSVESDKPAAATLTLDGEPLALDSNLTADIANVDAARPHVLRARVKAPNGSVAETEIAFGGLEAQTGRSLTGIPVRMLTQNAALTTATAKEWLATSNGAADVAGVDDVPGDVIIIRDPSNGGAIGGLEFGRAGGAVPNPLAESSDFALRHGKPQGRFVWPMTAATTTKLRTYILPLTRPFEFATANELKAVMARVAARRSAAHLQYADAVATAGLRAAATQRPRAVVLLIGGRQHDESELSPRQASEYLRAIGVPLFVWSFAQPEAAREWGDVVDVSSPKAFRSAFDALNQSLRSQRIVWVDGDYLPSEVAVTAAGPGSIETLAGHGTAGGPDLQARVEVHAIELAASVRDATGHVPRGLGPEDFIVLENGTPQNVIGVDYTQAAGPSQDHLMRNGQVVVFLQQSLSSTKGLRLALRSLASEVESVLAAGAVEVVTDYPRPHSLFGPTRDPIALRAFLEKLGNEISGEDEVTQIRTAFAANDLSKETEYTAQARTETAWRSDQIEMRARRESAVLRTREDALVGWLSRYPSAAAGSLRTLLLVSDGFDLEPASFYRFDRHETRVARRQELRALGASSHHEAIARAL